ncbi:hypothetical protein C8R43DRAFT_183690 [Mycena crocata]|nr:hypothetical protein C8R43DRAFT_183690 [Mycena crocata]
MSSMISDTAKTVRSNGAAAVELAKHAKDVTECIIHRVPCGGNGAAASALQMTLKEIQDYLLTLQRRRRRGLSWLLADHDKERFAQLNSGLDRALALVLTSDMLSVKKELRSHNRAVTSLISATIRLHPDPQSGWTANPSDLEKLFTYQKLPDMAGFCLPPGQFYSFFFFFLGGKLNHLLLRVTLKSHRGPCQPTVD